MSSDASPPTAHVQSVDWELPTSDAPSSEAPSGGEAVVTVVVAAADDGPQLGAQASDAAGVVAGVEGAECADFGLGFLWFCICVIAQWTSLHMQHTLTHSHTHTHTLTHSHTHTLTHTQVSLNGGAR